MPGASRRRTLSEKDGARILPSSGVDAPAERYMSGEMSATEMVDLICVICRNRLDQPPNGQLFSCDVPMAAQLAPPALSVGQTALHARALNYGQSRMPYGCLVD